VGNWPFHLSISDSPFAKNPSYHVARDYRARHKKVVMLSGRRAVKVLEIVQGRGELLSGTQTYGPNSTTAAGISPCGFRGHASDFTQEARTMGDLAAEILGDGLAHVGERVALSQIHSRSTPG
jgi:hypothetical protein